MIHARSFRRALLAWYRTHARDLPWRRERDPYAVWVSEVMLQQTRVAAVIPYYERFLDRFANLRILAGAQESEVLRAWSGLGYYSRARQVRKAALEILASGGEFPRSYDAIRSLPGVGDYTAAAIGSIAFGLPHAAVDGNVLRVMSRLFAERGDIRSAAVRSRLSREAQALLSRRVPGDFNQALMELGATLCLPRNPHCADCPVRGHCAARQIGIERELPLKLSAERTQFEDRTLLIVRRGGKLLMWRRDSASRRMAGFWELPEVRDLEGVRVQRILGRFRHTITRHRYDCRVAAARISRAPAGFSWVKVVDNIPLSTTTVKALRILEKPDVKSRRDL